MKVILSEEDVIELLTRFICAKFPKCCPCCDRRYRSLAEYLLNTTHLGKPISYDAEIGDWKPAQPAGTISLATCPCGTTLSISTTGMDRRTMWQLLLWARVESLKRGMSTSELLAYLRQEIDERVLREAAT